MLSRKELDRHRKPLAIGGAVPTILSALELPGEGCALFLHGAAGHLMQWHHQLAYFSERMRVVALDMRGHGESQPSIESRFWFEDFVDDLEAAVEALELPDRFYLVSHSFGGAVAAAYAVRHPERLDGLVLMATAGEIPLRFSIQLLMKLPSSLLSGVQRLVKNAVSTPPPVLKKLIPTLVRFRGWDLYPQIQVPTLVISGEYDMLTRPEPMRRMAELIPGSALEKIRFAAHLPQLERPQRVNQILERFLLPQRRVSWRPDSMESRPGA